MGLKPSRIIRALKATRATRSDSESSSEDEIFGSDEVVEYEKHRSILDISCERWSLDAQTGAKGTQEKQRNQETVEIPPLRPERYQEIVETPPPRPERYRKRVGIPPPRTERITETPEKTRYENVVVNPPPRAERITETPEEKTRYENVVVNPPPRAERSGRERHRRRARTSLDEGHRHDFETYEDLVNENKELKEKLRKSKNQRRQIEEVMNRKREYANSKPERDIYMEKGYEEQLPSLRHFEIAYSALKFGRKIGEGSFGTVWRGSFYNEKGLRIDVALKEMKDFGGISEDEFLNEARRMKNLQHPNLLRLIGVCRDGHPYYIVTVYMRDGSLSDCLREDRGNRINIPELSYMASQIASGMAYLELKKVVHRDLRAANVLITIENLRVKVADFGLARFTTGVYFGSEACNFPRNWTAPEGKERKKFTSKSDVWSFGMLLYEMITYGKTPHDGVVGMRRRSQWPRDYFEQMQDCLQYSERNRPSFRELEIFFDDYTEFLSQL